MLSRLSASILSLATWLQTASAAVPIYQLSLMAWFMFAIAGAFR